MQTNITPKKYKVNWYLAVLLSICVLFAILSYKSGTYLTGWDNIHLEFNYRAYLYTSFYGTWQDFQGLGTPTGISFTADLGRTLALLPFVLLFPTDLVRWIAILSMMITGPIGMFFLMRDVVLVGDKNYDRRNIVSLVSGVFYLLNLGTLQVFYTPTEMFTSQYGLLPLLLFFISKTIDTPSPRNLVILFILSFIGASMAITPTLFIPYAIIVVILFIASLIKRKKLTPLILVGVILILSNIHWVIPTVISIPDTSDTVLNSTSSRFVSEDIKIRSQLSSSVDNFTQLKGIWFYTNDAEIEDSSVRSTSLMGDWDQHVSSNIIKSINYAYFALVCFGLVISFDKRYRYSIIFASSFLIGSIMLIGDNGPTGVVFTFLRDLNPIVEEIFRFPFTKFSIITIFAFAGLLGIAIHFIITTVTNYKDNSKALFPKQLFIAFVIIFPLFVAMSPALSGGFINETMKQDIPSEYFQTFEWYRDRGSSGRVLVMPIDSPYGWIYNEWGYRGSGLLWYGIEQPIIDRAFDVWGRENETAYQEFKQAIVQQDGELFENLIRKYNVDSVIYDRSSIGLLNSKEALEERHLAIIGDSDLLSNSQAFGDIQIYYRNEPPSSATLVQDPIRTQKREDWSHEDIIYNSLGSYIYTEDPDLTPLFPSIDIRNENNILRYPDGDFGLSASNLELTGNLHLIDSATGEVIKGTSVDSSSTVPLIIGPENELSISIGTPVFQLTRDRNPDNNEYALQECMEQEFLAIDPEEAGFVLESSKDNQCFFIYLPFLESEKSYLTEIDITKKSGGNLEIGVSDPDSFVQSINHVTLERNNRKKALVLVNPSKTAESGRTFSFVTQKYQNINTSYLLNELRVFEYPYNDITSVIASEDLVLPNAPNTIEIEAIKSGKTDHLLFLQEEILSNANVVSIDQAYNDNWIAIHFEDKPNYLERQFPYLFGDILDSQTHQVLNGWQNSWEVNKQGYYYIAFWPQKAVTISSYFVLYTVLSSIGVIVYIKNKTRIQ